MICAEYTAYGVQNGQTARSWRGPSLGELRNWVPDRATAPPTTPLFVCWAVGTQGFQKYGPALQTSWLSCEGGARMGVCPGNNRQRVFKGQEVRETGREGDMWQKMRAQPTWAGPQGHDQNFDLHPELYGRKLSWWGTVWKHGVLEPSNKGGIQRGWPGTCQDHGKYFPDSQYAQ